MPSALNSATNAQQVAANSPGTGTSDAFVTPLRQYQHPSSPKAWGEILLNGTFAQAYNVAGVVDGGPGLATISFVVPFSGTNWMVTLGIEYSFGGTAATTLVSAVDSTTSGTDFTARCVRLSDYTNLDPNFFHFIAAGPQ